MTMKAVYKAKDGSDHSTPGAASKHNQLLKASEEFKKAAAQMARCLGATALTADGEPFDAEAAKYSLERHLTLPTSFRKPELASVDHVDAELHLGLGRLIALLSLEFQGMQDAVVEEQ